MHAIIVVTVIAEITRQSWWVKLATIFVLKRKLGRRRQFYAPSVCLLSQASLRDFDIVAVESWLDFVRR